jgi:hypothetical protein
VGQGGEARLLDGIDIETLGTIEGGGWIDLEPLRETLRQASICANDRRLGAALRVSLLVDVDGTVLEVRAPAARCMERVLRGQRVAPPSSRTRLTIPVARPEAFSAPAPS